MELTAIAGMSGAVTAIGIYALLKTAVAGYFLDNMDRPNAMHDVPVPRAGGIAIVVAVSLVVAVAFSRFGIFTAANSLPVLVIAPMLGLALVSLLDDRNSLPALLRLGAHCIAAIFVAMVLSTSVSQATDPHELRKIFLLMPIGSWVLVLAIIWMTNLYNFMDGANGLAGFMGAIGFASFAIASMVSRSAMPLTGSVEFEIICAAISGACLGFLPFNFPKPRIFMGDSGSIPLGFLAASLGIFGIVQGFWGWWFPILVFSPFIVDASVTLAKRMWRRERIWQAHRQHYYHRLILVLGWTHTKTTISYVLLMLAAASHAILAQSANLPNTAAARIPGYADPAFLVGGWVLIYALLLTDLERRFFKQKNNKNSDKKNDNPDKKEAK